VRRLGREPAVAAGLAAPPAAAAPCRAAAAAAHRHGSAAASSGACGHLPPATCPAAHLVAADRVGRVAGGVDLVDCVVGVVGEGHLHEVSLDKVAALVQAVAHLAGCECGEGGLWLCGCGRGCGCVGVGEGAVVAWARARGLAWSCCCCCRAEAGEIGAMLGRACRLVAGKLPGAGAARAHLLVVVLAAADLVGVVVQACGRARAPAVRRAPTDRRLPHRRRPSSGRRGAPAAGGAAPLLCPARPAALLARLTGDVAVREERDLAHGAADAAAHVEHLGVLLDLELERQVVLVALQGLAVGLVLPAVREVERGAPPCGGSGNARGR
jgi:hypothetical protein